MDTNKDIEVQNEEVGTSKTYEKEVKAGERISLTNFGTFEKVTVPEREGYNPADRKHITIPEKQKARFKVSKSFLD